MPPQYGFNVKHNKNGIWNGIFQSPLSDFLYRLARFDMLETNLGRWVLNRNGQQPDQRVIRRTCGIHPKL